MIHGKYLELTAYFHIKFKDVSFFNAETSELKTVALSYRNTQCYSLSESDMRVMLSP